MSKEILTIKTLIISLASVLIVCVLSYFIYINRINRQYTYDIQTQTFEHMLSDYIVPTPSETQLPELENETSIDHVVPFYKTEQIKYDGKSLNTILINDINDYMYTELSTGLLIEKDMLNTNSILIDLRFAEVFSVELGDSIELNISGVIYTYQVDGLFKENTFSSKETFGTVLFETPEVFSSDESMVYSGAYIVSNNPQMTWLYLADYAPLGRLRNQRIDESNEDYAEYVSDFSNQDYSLELIDLAHKKAETYVENEQLLNEVQTLTWIYYLLPLLLIALYIFYFHKQIKKKYIYYVQLGKIKRERLMKTISMKASIETLIFVILSLILVFTKLGLHPYSAYYKLSFDTTIHYVSFGIFVIFTYGYTYYQYRKIFQKKNV